MLLFNLFPEVLRKRAYWHNYYLTHPKRGERMRARSRAIHEVVRTSPEFVARLQAKRVAEAARRLMHPAKLRAEWRRHTYGIEPEEYDALFTKQHGVCAICGRPETVMLRGKVKELGVDHDHLTDAIRGLLCHSCNLMLGYAKDTIAFLRAAIIYLEKHNKMDADPSNENSD
jgi:hypothetical protein